MGRGEDSETGRSKNGGKAIWCLRIPLTELTAGLICGSGKWQNDFCTMQALEIDKRWSEYSP
jgi:hypothetical protein